MRIGRMLLGCLGVLTFMGCPPATLKEIVEDKFPDFKGLQTALKRDYIVGLQPAPGFPNLHCCWVGNRTGWEKIAGSWKTEEKATVDAGVLAVLSAFSIDISAKSVTFVEAEAEPFYRDQLVNIRHFVRNHCAAHAETPCAREICTDALKVGKVSVSTYTKADAGASAKPGSQLEQVGEKLQLVKIKGDSFVQDAMTAENIIVGYKMAPTMCGRDVWFGSTRTPSADPAQVDVGGTKRTETYEDHSRRFRAEVEKLNEAHSYIPVEPSAAAEVIPAAKTLPTQVLAPPPDRVMAGQVIRVTPSDAFYNPHAPIRGLVVTETSASGQQHSRTISTDASGGAWISVSASTASISIALDDREVYSTSTQERVAAPEQPPVIRSVKPFQSEGPYWIAESGGLAEISGDNLDSATEVLVAGEPSRPVAAGSDYVVAKMQGVGPTLVRVSTYQGFISPSTEVVLIRVSVEQVPPAVLTRGQAADIVLRIEGTSEPVAMDFAIDSRTIRFAGGGEKMRAVSSGGEHNTVRVAISAEEAGPYEITYRLASP